MSHLHDVPVHGVAVPMMVLNVSADAVTWIPAVDHAEVSAAAYWAVWVDPLAYIKLNDNFVPAGTPHLEAFVHVSVPFGTIFQPCEERSAFDFAGLYGYGSFASKAVENEFLGMMGTGP